MYTVYILHFDKPYKGIRHYTGYTIDLRNGSDFTVVRIWTVATHREAREKELKIKRAGARKYCPLCRGGKSD